jgi:FtsH-binding integral membrane protein
MSLEPAWYSTIYPVMFAVGQLLNGYAFALAVFLLLSDRPPFAGNIHPAHMRDFGSLLLAFVMFWAYMAFSQFLLIWVGNLPEETPWYLRRSREGWQYVIIFIAIFHFAVPFLLLLLRDIKEHRHRLLAVAAGLLVMRFIDIFWWIEPALNHEGEYFYWLLDVAAWVGVGGLFVWWFLGQLQSRTLLPLKDPNLAEALKDE